MAAVGYDVVKFRDSFGSFTDNWDYSFREKRIKVCTAYSPSEYDYQVTVSAGQLGASFRSSYDPDSSSWLAQSRPADARLDLDVSTASGVNRPTKYYLIAGNGAVVESLTLPSGYSRDGAGVQSITRPDGTFVSFEYNSAIAGSSQSELRAVVSSRGYAILYEYIQLTNGDWRVSKACALNLAETTLPALIASTICPAGAPTSTYSYDSNGELIYFVDQSGVGSNIGPWGNALYEPGAQTPYVTNNMLNGAGVSPVHSQTFADGRYIEYDWQYDSNTPVSNVMGGKYTENGREVSVNFDETQYYDPVNPDPTWYVSPGPVSIVDELGRTSKYSYCLNRGGSCQYISLSQMTDPEGGRQQFTYGSYDRLTRTDYVPKPGSNLPTRSETKSYGCTAAVCQRKPTSVTDANGNTTTYTYSVDHGGVLTEVDPAVNGVSPAKKYSYGQFYAWLKASGGGYVQAATPVWLLTEERSCNSSALDLSAGTCAAGSSDLVKTTYEYQQGSATKGSNMLLMGVAVTSGSETLRTCYGYDEWGRKISETSPKANLASCQ